MLHICKKLTCGRFTLNKKSQFVLALFAASKQLSNLSKGTCYLARHMAFGNPCFKNHRCLLWINATVLSKLIYNISGKFSIYLQIPRHLLHFIPTIIDIIIFTQVDIKRFNLITKYMVHDMKLFFI